MKTPIRIALSVAVVAMPFPAFAAPLSEAEITHIIKDVRTVDPKKTPRPAKLRERLHSQQSVRTGIASRTELLFNDKTLTRIGANSHFSFTEGTRNLELYRGVILLQVPKGAGGAQIRTAAITAAVTGTTILLEAGPGFTKVIVLEGHANITAHGDKARRKTVIKPGQAVIMPNTAKQVPPPVFINLAVLVETSALVSGTWTADLNEAPIVAAAAQQSPKDFTATNLAIIGPGTEVVFLPEGVRIAAAIPGKLGPPPFIPGTTVITPGTTILTDPSITSGGVTNYGTMYRSPAEDGPATQFVFGSGAVPQPAFDAAFASLNQPAVFRFADLQLQGGPRIITAGGPTDLVLASMGAITSGGGGAQTVNLAPLTSLTLAALGPISLSSELSIVGPGSRLWLSNDGPGNDIDVNSALDLAALRIDSAGNLIIGSDVNAANGVTLNAASNLTFGGTLFTNGLLAANAGGTIQGTGSALIDAKEVMLRSGGTLTFSHTGNSASFGTLLLDLTRTTLLDLGADILQLAGDIFLNKSLTLAGHLMTPANSTINVNDLNIGSLTMAGPLTLQGNSITVTGPISGNNTTVLFFSPSLSLTGATNAPTLNLRYQGTHFSMDQSITVREFRGDTGADFSSAPGAMLDAAEVILRYFNAGPDVVLSQAAADTAAVSSNGKSLTLDLQRTTSLTLNGADGRDVVVQGNFAAPGISVSLGDNGTANTRIEGNMIVGALGLGGANAMINGTITSGDLRISVAKSIASSVVQSVRVLVLNLRESPATLSQTGNIATFTSHPAGRPATSLQFDTSNLLELDLNGAPLTITSDFSVASPGVALSLRGGTVTALGNLTVAGALRLGMEAPANLSVAGVLNAGLIAAPGTDQSAAVSLDAAAVTASGGLRFGGTPGSFRNDPARPGAGLTLGITGPGGVLFGPGGINGASFNGGGNLDAGVNPAAGTLPDPRDAGAFTVNAQGDVIVNVPIHATTGRNTNATQTGGAGGTVELTSENGTVSVNSTIEVSSNDPAERRRSAKGGNIRLTSKKLTGIAIQHTGQLKALLDAAAPGPGGEITFASLGGDIVVNGGTVTADRGKIDIRNQGGSGLVNLSGAALAADVVKVGALGSDGMLRIGGGSIDANTTIQLYAGGSNGTVEFVDNATLSGSSMKAIAANTVTIVNGKVVTVLGPAASVFTNQANYTGSGGNGSTTGSFGGSGASTFAFDHPGKPPF